MTLNLDPFLVSNGTLAFLGGMFGFWLVVVVVAARRRIRYANPGWMTQLSIAFGLGIAVARVAALKYLGI